MVQPDRTREDERPLSIICADWLRRAVRGDMPRGFVGSSSPANLFHKCREAIQRRGEQEPACCCLCRRRKPEGYAAFRETAIAPGAGAESQFQSWRHDRNISPQARSERTRTSHFSSSRESSDGCDSTRASRERWCPSNRDGQQGPKNSAEQFCQANHAIVRERSPSRRQSADHRRSKFTSNEQCKNQRNRYAPQALRNRLV